MDQATQQNAAMVEETTAASHSLASEAQSLRELLMQFDIGEGTRLTSRPTSQPAYAGTAPLRMAHANLKKAAGWEEF